MQNNAGVPRYEMTYDQRGHQIAIANFDEKGEPVRDNEGIASSTANFDQRGNKIEVAIFDEGGKLAQNCKRFCPRCVELGRARKRDHGNLSRRSEANQ